MQRQSKMGVTFAKDWDVAEGESYSSVMVQCLCGDVFQVSGTSAFVSQEHQAWAAKHTDCVQPLREGRKVFWLSFCDNHKPAGQQFLGACLIDVTAEEADDAAIDILIGFPFAKPGAEWLGAAVKKSHRLGCNPGGEVASVEIDPTNPNLSAYTFGVLMDRATVNRIDAELGVSE